MVEILFIFVPRPCDSFLAYGGQRPLFMQLGHVFYLCISNFKNTRSNCKAIHNAFLHSCVGVKPQILSIFTLHKPTLWLSPEPPYKGGHSWVTVAPHPFGIAVYTGIFPSVGFPWHKLPNEVMQKCVSSHWDAWSFCDEAFRFYCVSQGF